MTLKRVGNVKESAALMLAEGELSHEEISKRCNITRRTLANWRLRPEFAQRVTEIEKELAERALQGGIAKRERRLSVLNDLHDKLLRVIEERSRDAGMDAIPGGSTGLVTRTELKIIGKGDNAKPIEVFEVDTATVKEIRAIQEQVAKELGQWEPEESGGGSNVQVNVIFDL